MPGISNYIDKWEDERAECVDRYLNCFANYILFFPRLLLGKKRNLE